MMDGLLVLVMVLVVVVAVVVVRMYDQRRYSTLASERDFLQRENERLESLQCALQDTIDRQLNDLTLLKEDYIRLQSNHDALQQSDASFRKNMKENEDSMKVFFENMAVKVLEQKSERLTQVGEKQLREVIAPFERELEQFKKKVEELHLEQAKEKASLSTELKQLMLLNKRLGEEANTLARAIKGEHNPKIQGDWGEMILDTILSNSGLEKGVHYFPQESFLSVDGELQRPDVIVRYPDSREIIIDSKVSLNAYSRYVNAADDQTMQHAAQEHVVSVRRHIDQLSDKRYFQREKSLDFVMMFMPIEPAYVLALGIDGGLWDYAYKKKIVLVSPTHLITALKLVYDLWSRDAQTRNAIDIAARGAQMYDKFVGFVLDMQSIDKSLQSASKAYGMAMGKLSTGKGSLVRQAEMLKELGVRASKELNVVSALYHNEDPSIDESSLPSQVTD